MIKRIINNEEKLDKILDSIKKLEESLNVFKDVIPNIKSLNRYYGSKGWFKDKELYEKNILPKVKAGVLSEDSVWNMNEDIRYLTDEMMEIISQLKNNIIENR